MAKKTSAVAKATVLTERPNRLLSSLIKTNNARAKKDIAQWRTALQQAENPDNPKRILLYNLYYELLLDAHLSAEIEKRVLAIQGLEYNLISAEGEIDSEATLMLKKAWFFNLLGFAMESKFWGHSLVEIKTLTAEGLIAEIELVPRRHVIPEKGIFTLKQGDDKGVLYQEDTSVSPWIFEIGEKTDLGLLNKCAPHVLYKRFAQAAWSEFCEIFGMPVRYAQTNTKDLESLRRLEQMMIDMATASYAVLDKEETLQFIETAKSDGGVYMGLIGLSSSEISKLINGSVIGEANQGGSRSKEEVGLEVQKQISKADKKRIESFINETVLPKLLALGYPVAGLSFEFEKSKDIKQDLETFTLALQYYEIEPEVFTETFGIKVLKAREVVNPSAQPEPKGKETKALKGKNDFFA